MAYLPANLGLRFILELVGLYALGYWGWTQTPGFLRYLLALILPVSAAVIWATFRAIEPVKPKQIPVVVQGRVRLLLELAFFALAVAALVTAGRWIAGAIYGAVVIFHYLASIDRISWLMKPG
jgi:hypothetical protein